MTHPQKIAASVFIVRTIVRLFSAAIFATTFLLQAQTYTVLHSFSGAADGATPYSGVTLDRGGNLYGTANEGGDTASCGGGCGTVYQLKRAGAGWILNSLYIFHRNDGAYPYAGVVFGPGGSLYGSTSSGGNGSQYCFDGCGLIFKLNPPATACHNVTCSWQITSLYKFAGWPNDGEGPGNVAFGSVGNIYGTAGGGFGYCEDLPGCGIVFELSPGSGGWSETILYDFANGGGFSPNPFVVLDSTGNVYGTTNNDFLPYNTVFEVTPEGNNSPFQTLYDFYYGGPTIPLGGVIFDTAGNLYGTTSTGGSGNGGVVFELMHSGNSWIFNVLYNLVNPGTMYSPGPRGNLAMDAAGSLYGTTYADGANGCGSIFKLTQSNGNWTYTSLHDFTCGSDGAYPYSTVVLDSAGNVYGTASAGGSQNKGVVFEITP